MASSIHDGPHMNALIHRAVRRDLGDFTTALERFPAGDRTRAAALAARFHWLDVLLTHHHQGEEQILWPVLRSSPPDTQEVAELTDEHERIVAALAGARTAFERFGSTAALEDTAIARAAVAELTDAATEHFGHEEAEIVELCAHADPAALREAFKKLGRNAGLKESLWFMQWVSDGLPADERSFLKELIPAPVHWISKAASGRAYASATAPLHP